MGPLLSDAGAIKAGWLAGWAAIVLWIVYILMYVLAALAQVEVPAVIIDPIYTVIVNALYMLFLWGVRGIAVRKGDDVFRKTMNTYFVLSVIMCILLFPMSLSALFSPDFLLASLVAVIPLICINGIVVMRLADNFQKYADGYGSLGKRIVWWNKTAGWMLASIILSPLGALFSLLADFFLWRLLALEAKK